MNDMNRTTAHRTGAVALDNAVRYAEEAERCDAAQQFDDRDVRLRFAEVWARIASAALLKEQIEKDDPMKRRML